MAGVVLRPLGHRYWGAAQTDSGLTLLGGSKNAVLFSEMAGPATLTKTLGFSALTFPLKDGTTVKIAGLAREDATDFASITGEAFRAHFAKQFSDAEQELQALAEVAKRLEKPRRYPAACLLRSFVQRANRVGEHLPAVVPDGVLSDDQHIAGALVILSSGNVLIRMQPCLGSGGGTIEEIELADGSMIDPASIQYTAAATQGEDGQTDLNGADANSDGPAGASVDASYEDAADARCR